LEDLLIKVSPPGPRSKRLIKRWKKCSPKKTAYPAFSEAKGIYVKDVDGNRYMNFTDLTNNVGHNNPRVKKAVKSQLIKGGISKIRGPNKLRIELMEKMREIVGQELFDGKFEFCTTGSDATEFALKIARAYTGKSIIISYLGAHHGFSMGALSLTADRSENRRFCLPLVPNIVHIPYPYCYRCPFNQEKNKCNLYCLDYLKYIFDTLVHPDETAAIFIEPIQQVAGIITPPKNYFSKLKKICTRNNILIVDDEVATGFGRTGKMFGVENWDLIPDIMFFGKAFANGISMAGILARREIMEKESEFPLVHGTFTGNLISCAAAIATIEEIQKKDLVKKSYEMGKIMIKRFMEMKKNYDIIGDVRGKGLLIGIELVTNQKDKKPATKEATKIVKKALKKGLLVTNVGTYKQVLRLTPPLIITNEESNRALDILDETIKEVERE
jgi:4-aminobutyrate aminotransferase